MKQHRHSFSRKVTTLCLTAGLLGGVAGCAQSDDSTASGESAAGTDELDTVRGTYSAIAAYAPLFVAMEEGFFTKHGIANEMDEVRINEALPLVASGEYDWGRAENDPGWFNALNSGLDLYGAVDRLTYTCSADNTLVVSSDIGDDVEEFSDLEGKTIGIIAPGTQGDYWLAQLLEENGMAEDAVSVVNLGYPDQLAAMASGNLDAAFMLEPLLTEGLTNGTIEPVISMLDVTPDANIGTMIFGGHFVEREDGDVATRWIAAWLEAARFAQDPANRDAILQAVQKWTDMEMSTLETIYDGKTTWPQVNVNGFVDANEVIDTQAQYMLDGGFIDELPSADRLFQADLVDRALEIVGEVSNEDAQLCAE